MEAQSGETMAPEVMLGIVERHYLKCPFCDGRADLQTHRCSKCGAKATSVNWEHDTPELAMVSRTYGNRWY